MPSTAPTETFNTWKHNAIAMSAALAEAERVMVGSVHLEAIAETLCEAIYKECEGYITPFIPKGADDSSARGIPQHNVQQLPRHYPRGCRVFCPA